MPGLWIQKGTKPATCLDEVIVLPLEILGGLPKQ